MLPRLYLRARAALVARSFRALGAGEALRFWGLKASSRGAESGVRTLRSRDAAHPLLLRAGTSDVQVFQQIFVDREYACLDGLREVETVIDCGANAGYSAAWFLSRWPGARVLAVEPDAANAALLRRNLASYGGRAEVLRAAVWPHAAGLRMEETAYRGGAGWSRQVREAAPDEPPALEGTTIDAVIERIGAARVSLLKMDIEGAEAVVFAGPCDWLDRVDALAVELHDDSHFGSGTAAFERAIVGRGFAVSRCGELTVCVRPSAGGAA